MCLQAVSELQSYLKSQNWEHNFGFEKEKPGNPTGKMFGVLIVQNSKNEIGFLAAFSGKLSGENDTSYFVPHVFDRYHQMSFFITGEQKLNVLNEKDQELENDAILIELKAELKAHRKIAEETLEAERLKAQKAKSKRQLRRATLKEELSAEAFAMEEKNLNTESQNYSRGLKRLKKKFKAELVAIENKLAPKIEEINQLKNQRKQKSNQIQRRLFQEYDFLNISGASKNLLDIFTDNFENIPPAGAGDCAAPKLLQYAFQNNFRPLSIAEFWWGESPKTVIRKHGNFYPACRGKCEPILAHMLEGIEMEENPMLINPAEGKQIEIVFEDENLLVINKPAEFLSVPGKNIQDSVWVRMKQRMPDATGPLIVHRLDMSTSCLLYTSPSPRDATLSRMPSSA